jgi:3'(2'), 5'-bisphosphate nucleotidase
MRDLATLVQSLMPVVERASAAIMQIYDGAFAVQRKDDNSPLTLADLESQRVIIEGLKRITPDIPILSEESAAAPWVQRQTWRELWVVDPLDGTREFVKRNGEFTVNIALVEDGEPVLGVVYAPARTVLYGAARGCGAFRCGADAARMPIHVQSSAPNPLRVLGSRSHGDARLDHALERLGPQQRLGVGSALKFGLVADGSGDLYVRRGETSEWDTAAGQAVVLEAGGSVVDLHGQPLRYNQRDSLINPWFMAYGDRSRDWIRALGPL